MNKNKKAFTLIELLVVIAIIGILFIVLVSKVDFATDKAKTSGVQTDAQSYRVAAHTVATEHQGLTSDLNTLCTQLNDVLDPQMHLILNQNNFESISKTDPWGMPYIIEYMRTKNDLGSLVIISGGPDIEYNTKDDIINIVTYEKTNTGFSMTLKDAKSWLKNQPAGLYDKNYDR